MKFSRSAASVPLVQNLPPKMLEAWDRWVQENQLRNELEATMLREYSYLLYMGGIVLNLNPKYIVYSISQNIIFSGTVTFHAIVMAVSSFKSGNFVAIAQYLNIVSLCVISLGINFAGVTHRQSVVRILEIMSKDFYDYGPSFKSPETDGWKSQLRTFKIIIVVCLPVYLIIVAGSVVFREYIDLMLGYKSIVDDYDGEIYLRTPIRVWFPFKITNDFHKYAATLSQMFVAAILATTLGAGDVMMLFLGQTVALQLRILCLAATKMDDRARNMYMDEFKSEPPTDSLKRAKDKKFEFCYNRCIKQLVEHHLIIQKFYLAYYDLAKWPTAIAFLNGSVIIAMSILVATSESEGEPSTYINSILLLIAEVMSMWLLCETGQQVNNWSERLFTAVYEFNWIDISTSNKKMVMILKENIKKPLLMMAGGLTPINRDTFGSIMNTAYSYVNLSRVSLAKKRDD